MVVRKETMLMITTEQERKIIGGINSCLALLNAWKQGNNKVTLNKQEPLEHTYTLNNYMSVIESNLLEAITPPTEQVKRGDGRYEILESI